MERLQQNIENLKAEAAESGEEEVNIKCVNCLFSICVLKCWFRSFSLLHVLVSIKISVAISEKLFSITGKATIQANKQKCSRQKITSLFFLLEPMGLTHRCFHPLFTFIFVAAGKNLEMLRVVHII